MGSSRTRPVSRGIFFFFNEAASIMLEFDRVRAAGGTAFSAGDMAAILRKHVSRPLPKNPALKMMLLAEGCTALRSCVNVSPGQA